MKTKLTSAYALLAALTLCLTGPLASAQTGWGSALDFDGVNDYVSVPLTLPDTGTIEMWYYVEPYYNYQTLFDNNSDPNDWEMWIYTSGEVRFQLQDGDARYDLDNLDGPNHWYHFAVTWQKHGTQADYSLYVNGVWRAAVINQAWVAPGSTLYLAGGNAGNTKGNGKMDEVRIWNVSRSGSQILSSMNQRLTGTEAGLVACWHFDEGTGTTTADATGHGYAGTLVNGPTWIASTLPIGQPLLSNSVVTENQPAGTTVGTLSAIDPDNNRTFTFALVAGTGDTDNTSFTIAGSTLQTATSFDYETKNSYSVRVGATDQGNSSVVESSFTINVINVNDAPVLDITKTPVLNDVWMGAGVPNGPMGTTVMSLVDIGGPMRNVADGDVGAVTGVAITGAQAANGTWHYTVDNGATWNPLGPISEAAARLLDATSGSRVYFQPNAGFSGIVSTALTFRAWDRTAGVNGATADTTANGGSSAFSASTDTADLNVVALSGWGTALSFDGVNDYVSVPDGVYFQGNFTIEAWVYPRAYSPWARVLDFGYGQNWILLTFCDSSGMKPHLRVGGGTFTAPGTLRTNEWVHLAASVSGTTCVIYTNGVVAGTGTVEMPANVVRTSNKIAASNYPGEQNANVMLDEIRLWSVARSGSQILSSMNQRLTGTEDGVVAYWHFDEGTGTTAADATGHGFTGTLVNGPSWVSSTVPKGQPVLSNSSVAENQPAGTTVGTLSAIDPDNSRTFAFALVAGTGDTDNASFSITGSTLETAATFDRETKSSYSIRVRATDQGDSTWQEMSFIVTILNSPETVVVANANDSGAGSLREAIVNGGAGDTIIFAPGVTGPISLTTVGDSTYGPSAFAVTHALTIEGNGITLQRNGSVSNLRLFYVSPSGDLTLRNVTLSNGLAQGGNGGLFCQRGGGGGGAAGLGGAILNRGTLELENSTLTGNRAAGGSGGQYTYAGQGGGGGGGGLASNGASSSGMSGGNGGGPNGGAGGNGGNGVAGGTGGGGGGGYAGGYAGGAGGFGGGGGGGGGYGGGLGGAGGFGAGGGGAGGGPADGAVPAVGGFGGGSGAVGQNGGNVGSSGGGGAGLGGAIFNEAGTLSIINSTISGNTAQGGNGGGYPATTSAGCGFGAGVFNHDGTVTVLNSTFTGNTVSVGTGGTPSKAGGAVYNLQQSGTATLTLRNTILANSVGGSDATNNAGTVTGDHNLVETSTGLPGGVVSLTSDPQLGSLANNGGLTFTHALLSGSPAIDAGDDSACPATDQRGDIRPQDGNSDSIIHSDIGAYEVPSPPTDIALSSSTVLENQPVGTTVGTLTATDSTPGDTHVFTLVSGAGSTDNAAFTIDGGVLQTPASFDYETKSSYSIRVRATDQGGLYLETQITITVTDVNDAPTDISLSNSTVPENQPSGTAVGTFTATDPDTGDAETFTLVSGASDTDNASFTIDGGALQTAAAFNYEVKNSYSIRVRATDLGSLSVERTFTISVQDVTPDLVVTTAADSGAGSLRAAIASAAAGEVIGFDAAVTGPISLSTVGDNTYGPSALAVTKALTIEGNGMVIQRDGSVANLRLFYVSPSGDLTLRNVTLSGGAARGEDGQSHWSGGGGGAGLAGAIFNEGTLTIDRSTLNANQAVGGNGGNYVAVSGGGKGGGPFGGAGGGSGANGQPGGFASGGGGGGASAGMGTGGAGGFGGGRGGSASAGVTYGGAGGFGGGGGGGNACGGGGGAGLGGAIFNNAGIVLLNNSTISGNSSSRGSAGTGCCGPTSDGAAGTSYGGGLFNLNGQVETVNCTFSGNTAQSSGAGIYSLGDGAAGVAALTLRNTIVANSTGGNDLQITARNGASSTSSGIGNLVELQSGFAGSIVTTADPILDPLANNGGLTFTHALLPGSPAIDAGDDSACPATDQRGAIRPQDGNSDSIIHSDIGAYEVPSPPTDIALSSSTVLENQPIGTTVGALTTTDSTPGDSHVFTLVSGDGDTDNGSFAIDGDALQTAASFNYEVKSSYTLRVRATDLGGSYFEEQFTITVTDVNDAPVANLATYTRITNMSLKIPVTDLLNNFTGDDENDTRTLVAVRAGTNNATISMDAARIYYAPSATDPNRNTTDHFSYEISDGRGGLATNVIRMTVAAGGDPGSQGANIVGLEPAGGCMMVKFRGIPNYQYRIQRTEAMNGQNTVWTELPGPATEVSTGYFEYEDASPPPETGCYRTVWP